MIELNGVRKSFGEQKVLNGIDLRVDRGETLVVLGRSGTGKSVLLKLLIGLQQPDDGTIRIDGEEIQQMDQPLHQQGGHGDPDRGEKRHQDPAQDVGVDQAHQAAAVEEGAAAGGLVSPRSTISPIGAKPERSGFSSRIDTVSVQPPSFPSARESR